MHLKSLSKCIFYCLYRCQNRLVLLVLMLVWKMLPLPPLFLPFSLWHSNVKSRWNKEIRTLKLKPGFNNSVKCFFFHFIDLLGEMRLAWVCMLSGVDNKKSKERKGNERNEMKWNKGLYCMEDRDICRRLVLKFLHAMHRHRHTIHQCGTMSHRPSVFLCVSLSLSLFAAFAQFRLSMLLLAWK